MRRRRWLLIGISMGLIGLCWFGYQYEEPPPYEFLQGAHLWLIDLPKGSSRVRMIYTVEKPLDPIGQMAHRELWERSGRAPEVAGFGENVEISTPGDSMGLAPFRPSDSRPVGYPPVPPNTTGFVVLSRRVNLLGRFRAWLFGLRWKGGRP